ncbi:F-box protein At4g00755-like isoform X2 [Gastrolobium bilobum]|nr:F-box protein At4g00755-like isoform X2 [Gastrolobium bilobum]XP_061339907.1 F-box protein At4g00755-like isoform X2 [Gastrolobium bilobum]
MESCMDFLSRLDYDTSLKILKCLDDPADLVRVSCVSRSWRHYVITNGLFRQLCLRIFPQLSRAVCVAELNGLGQEERAGVGTSYSTEWIAREREHRVYSYLARAFMSTVSMNCIAKTIGASSTDNFPQESIDNTLEQGDNIGGRFSYWSSSGQNNPDVPETLTYELISKICVITDINIQPFLAHFQMGSPIYSARSVRFKMGHPKAPFDPSAEGVFIWTYTSPEFPMTQENRLQKFRLPEPVLCIGGILQIELLGRVQRQEMDGLLYICVSYVEVLGRSLSPKFRAEVLDPSGLFVLKSQPLGTSENEYPEIPTDNDDDDDDDEMQTGEIEFRRISNELRAQALGEAVEDDWDEDEYEDEDFEVEYAL